MSHGYNLRTHQRRQTNSIEQQNIVPEMATVADALDVVPAVGNRMDAVETGQTALANQFTAITQQLATPVAASGALPYQPVPASSTPPTAAISTP